MSRNLSQLLYYDRVNLAKIAYGSSGVKCTGSSVNSGGKFARSRSESRCGL